MAVLSILFLIIQVGFVIFFFYMCVASLTGAPYVPTKTPTADAMMKLSGIKKGDVVYDLGSGDGKLLLLAAKKGARATGYEINPLLVLYANLRHARTLWKNFWGADIHDADIVFIYLLPWKMERLAKKLKTECKKGAVIVSNSFIFPGWTIIRQDAAHHVYVFRV